MEDVRSLYINQLLNHYRDNSIIDSAEFYLVQYRYPYPACSKPIYRYFHHNEGIEFVKQYIKDLEKKVDELQYVERIIKAAKEHQDDKI